MKTRKILAILVLVLGLVVCQARLCEAAPVGTAFTYQGHLYDANHVADGEYDFQFKLFDDPCTGSQVGGDVNEPDVDVIDALFTVELDFGDAFDGDARWLEIGVRPGDQNDPCAYSILQPRQEITPTPYALYAETSGSVSWGEISDRPAGLDDGDDVGITSETDPQVGSNDPNYVPKWDGSALVTGTIYDNGNVGIGTSNPGETLNTKFDVFGRVSLRNEAGSYALKADYSDSPPGYMRIYSIKTGGGTGRDFILGVYPSGHSNQLVLKNNGNVGVGTTSPEANLHVVGSPTLGSVIIAPSEGGSGDDAEIVLAEDDDYTYGMSIKYDGGDDSMYVYGKTDAGSHGPHMTITRSAGDVGIGTTLPGARLHVEESGSTDPFRVRVSEQTKFIVKNDGDVGIGIMSPSEKLDVYGGTARLRGISSGSGTAVVADGNGKLWKLSSSKRYKTNIQGLEDNPNSVLQLRPVRFQWKTTGQQDVGLIAEEVEEHLQELVIYDNQGRPDAVKYDRVALYLLDVVKTQQEKIAVLEERLEVLENTTQQQFGNAKEVQQ